MRRAWRALGDTRLTFWCLCAVAALLLVGAARGNADFALVDSLNQVTIQRWLADHLAAHLSRMWWLPALLVALAALGANAVACTAQRAAALWSTRAGRPRLGLLRELLPTFVHALFAVVLAGHLLTITCGEWRRIPLREGAVIEVPHAPALAVAGRRDELSAPAPGRARRLVETRVALVAADGAAFEVSHGAPLAYGGAHIVLDRRKPAASSAGRKRGEGGRDAQGLRGGGGAAASEESLVVVVDPGVRLIVAAFAMILLLMVVHFATRRRPLTPTPPLPTEKS